LTKEGDIKLCDFGISARDNGKRDTTCGTSEYLSAEMRKKNPHTTKTDVWSLANLWHEIISGETCFLP